MFDHFFSKVSLKYALVVSFQTKIPFAPRYNVSAPEPMAPRLTACQRLRNGGPRARRRRSWRRAPRADIQARPVILSFSTSPQFSLPLPHSLSLAQTYSVAAARTRTPAAPAIPAPLASVPAPAGGGRPRLRPAPEPDRRWPSSRRLGLLQGTLALKFLGS
jgi:hypothetical protein